MHDLHTFPPCMTGQPPVSWLLCIGGCHGGRGAGRQPSAGAGCSGEEVGREAVGCSPNRTPPSYAHAASHACIATATAAETLPL